MSEHDPETVRRGRENIARIRAQLGAPAKSATADRPDPPTLEPDHPVDEKMLAQFIFALRICLPEIPLVLSTREPQHVRDGMAGLGISKMSVASKTTVGGYSDDAEESTQQFEISDERNTPEFCDMLRSKGLEPVFKNWDATFRNLKTER